MADEIVLPNSGVAINADTGVGMPTSQDSNLLHQMLMMYGITNPETIAEISNKNADYEAGIKTNTDAQINGINESNQQYQTINSNVVRYLMNNAEQQDSIAKSQIELSKQAAEASAVITDNVNAARNNTLLQIGGIQALDSMGFKIQQAMALNEQKQLAAQQAVKDSNPVVEGLLSAFGIKSQAQAAVEEADTAQENYTRTVRQRNDLVTAMSGADSLVTQLGTALNGATQKAALDSIAAKSASDAAILEKQALSNDAQSMVQLSNLQTAAIQHNLLSNNTTYQLLRQELTTKHQNDMQLLYRTGAAKSKEDGIVKTTGSLLGHVSTELQRRYIDAYTAKDAAAMQAAQSDADNLIRAGAILGVTPQNKKEWEANFATTNRIASEFKAGKPDSEVMMELKNPLLTSRFMENNQHLYSGSAAIYNPESISAMQGLIGSFIAHTTNGGKGKPLAPQEVAQVNTEVLKTLEKEAANPFSSRNKVIRMDAASLIAAAQTSPDSPFARSQVTQFLLNRYKENPKAVITLNDYKDYIISQSKLGGFGTITPDKQAITEVLRHINALYADTVNRSGVRVYGADYNIVPKVISLYVTTPGVSGVFSKPTRVAINNPDALSRAFKNASGWADNYLGGHFSNTPIQNLFYTEEGDK
jgi:hypothetical protein